MTAASTNTLVLVTGATGFIAGHCVRELLEHGYAVRGTVRSVQAHEKYAHLRATADRTGGTLELVEADLGSDRGWREAVAGCTYVWHVASPFPAEVPKDEMDLIRPAVDGTKRVLSACAASGTVKRVVLTSSVAAIAFGHDAHDHKVRTEADWSNVDRCEAYPKSKTLAERAAWDFVDGLPAGQRFELAVINPGFVLGPVMNADPGTSDEVVRKLLAREMPACPRIGFAPVDVRDVAIAHRLAMESPRAPGNRYICAGDHMWIEDMAKVLAAEFNPKGYRVPTGRLPYWLMWVIARFDKTIRLALEYVGREEQVSCDKAKRELVGECAAAVRGRDLHVGLYYSGGMDWLLNPERIDAPEKIYSTILDGPQYVAYADAHWRELIDRYRPSVLWGDIMYPPGANTLELFADYYNRVPDGVINDRFATQFTPPRMPGLQPPGMHYDFITPEYTSFDEIQAEKWETCRGISSSFGYNRDDDQTSYLSAATVIRMLVDIVSKNGNLLLNVGPRADGSIHELQRECLRGLGAWLAVNGEAVRGTRPWSRAESTTACGVPVRFTRNDSALYALLLGTPREVEVRILGVCATAASEVRLLGHDERLEWRQSGKDLIVQLPASLPDHPAYALRMTSLSSGES